MCPRFWTTLLLLIVTASSFMARDAWAQTASSAEAVVSPSSGTAPARTAASAPVRPLPTTDEILQKYRSALGGEEIWSAISTRSLKGIYQTEDLSGFAGIEIVSKAPNMSFSIITLPNGVTVHEVCDGKSAWLEDTVGGVHEFSGAALKSRILDASFGNRADILARMSPRGVIGTQQVGVHNTYAVAFAAEKNVSSKVYFDQDTGFVVRVDDLFRREDGDYPVETDLDDYRPVDGAYYPFRIRHVERGNVFTIRVTWIKNNVPVDASAFVRPGSPSNSH